MPITELAGRFTIHAKTAPVPITYRVLPSGLYNPRYDEYGNVYLRAQDTWELPSTLYGDETRLRSERIITTYLSRANSNTGVLLSGVQGSGKSLLVKHVAMTALQQRIPSIVIDVEIEPSAIVNLLSAYPHKVLLVIDEFEKVYRNVQHQEELLGALDGTGNALVFVSCNDPHKISPFMFNRPRRMFYHYQYSQLPRSTVEAYVSARSTRPSDNATTLNA